MGGPMARHLKQAGHELTVYNRSRAKAENWVSAYGGTLALSPGDAAKDAEVVISCVGTDDDLAGVTLGRDGAFAAMAKGSGRRWRHSPQPIATTATTSASARPIRWMF